MMVESSILNTGMVRIAQKIIHPVGTKRIANDNFGEHRLPGIKLKRCGTLWSDRQLNDVVRSQGRRHLFPYLLHFLAVNDRFCHLLMIEAIWKEFFLGSMREW